MRPGTFAILLSVLLFTASFGQAQETQTRYEVLWKKVTDLSQQKGLTRSALQEIDRIYALAKKEKEPAQLIKALIYQVTLGTQVDDNNVDSSFKKIQREISTAEEPARSILYSLLAEQYLGYFQQHRWQLYNRTPLVETPGNDITGWSVNDFHKQITEAFLASIRNKKILQSSKLEPFEAIIIRGNARYLRPTLYDLLANRALDYFSTDENDITRPAYAFELRDEKLFAPAALFAGLKLQTSDSLSLHHRALYILQDLLNFHANDAKPDAFIEADIRRLRLVNQYGVMEKKDSLYAMAIKQITDRYPDEPTAAQASWLLAQWHADKAASYDPLTDTTNRYRYLQALAICEKAVQQKQESEGRTNCMFLLNQIRHRELNMQTEKVNVPGEPFRTLVSFRNVSNIFLRIVPLTDQLKQDLSNRYDDAYWKQLTALKPTRSWRQSLPATNDYQRHSTEIKIDSLPRGTYLLLASEDEAFSPGKNVLAAQYIHVSNISYINKGNEYFVLNRSSGQALAKASVQAWTPTYNYNNRKSTLIPGQKFFTDQNGYGKLAALKNTQENVRLEIDHNNDHLFLDDNPYSIYRGVEDAVDTATTALSFETAKANIFFFTDRSIYRPGQSLYFKGIAITRDYQTRQTKVFARFNTVVFLMNANGEPADSLQLTTNEFGSYSGSFKLPVNQLNGEFRLVDKALGGEAVISVEEYKRPKFFVEYDTLKATYRVNDSLIITAAANAYAGNHIDGATVKYRVTREPRFIYPWLYWKRGLPRGNRMEITNGIAITDQNGRFTVRFKAVPDLTIDSTMDPVFDYRIIADVTDINGETRSAETTISVSYKSLLLNINLPDGALVSPDSLRNISIGTTNLAAQFQPALVHVSLNRLAMPGRLIRARYWNQPDQFVMSREQYLAFFPFDEFKDENDYHTWPRTETVFETTDTTKPNAAFRFSNASLKDGWYSIEAVTKDEHGKEVKAIQYLQVYNEKNKLLPSLMYAMNKASGEVVEPGASQRITIGSSAPDVFVVQQIERLAADSLPVPGRPASVETGRSLFTFHRLNNEKKSFEFPVTENDRGGFGVFHFFVKNNRFYQLSNQVLVPWSNKDLSISYKTFRDKTLPGSAEKWKIKISGYKKEKITAQLLASMYDASLDQFKPHRWNIPAVWPVYSPAVAWNGQANFAAIQSQERPMNEGNVRPFSKEYDRIIPLETNRGRFALQGRIAGIAVDQAAPAPRASGDQEVMVASKKEPPGVQVENEKSVAADQSPEAALQIRRNFNETAFFLPELTTDPSGNIEFGFTIPEALTRWKFQALAYTKDAAFGYSTRDIITQKQLMVQPNTPRFLREGDHLELSTKVVNMTAAEMTGTVQLELFNAADMKPVDGWFQNMTANQFFTAEAGKSVTASFTIQVPYQFNSAVVYRFTARSGIKNGKDSAAMKSPAGAKQLADLASLSDAEELAIPVLTNNMLVTETLPIQMRGTGTRNYRFEKLLQSGSSETLQQNALTVEFTSNPAWYVVQALPFLVESKYECSEQMFNRFYANALASTIANSSPRLKAVFEGWKRLPNAVPGDSTGSAGGLRSTLEKNPELKSALLEETPWVLASRNERDQKKNIALLFDQEKMGRDLESSLDQLKQFQSPNGGFVWFKGGPDDRFMTQYILTGIGRLKHLNALPTSMDIKINDLVSAGLSYLDKRIMEDYELLLANKTKLGQNNTGYLQIQFGYMRSFFPDYPIPGGSFNAIHYYRKQSQQYWLSQNKMMQGMIALALNRTGDKKTAGDILRSLEQNAVVSEEMGMYWKDNRSGYYWYQAPVETQSLLIEAFEEIGKEKKITDALKTWLLKQKQTSRWPASKSSADACYALLLNGNDWLNAEPVVELKLGDKTVSSNDAAREAGSGYFSKIYAGPFVNPSMGEITVQVLPSRDTANHWPNSSQTLPVWGAVYWQYFEKLDRITPSSSPLKLTKKIFVEKNTAAGPVLQPVLDNAELHVGDKVKVRIELSVDRAMEYVQLKDMRAASLEPVNVLSSYKWQGGLGYYETTRDLSTSFFFNWLPKGNHVFEYALFVTHSGQFSNGITSIQCLYAPEFSSHSEGIRINVDQD